MTEEKNTTPLHGSNVAREQIPTACKWHISDIYAGENDWQAACEEYKSKLPQLQAMQGQLNTAAAVCAALKLQEELAKLLDKIYAYARLQQDADNTDQKLQALAGEAEGMAAAFSNANAFVEPEMLALGKEKLLQMLDEEPALAEYRFILKIWFVYQTMFCLQIKRLFCAKPFGNRHGGSGLPRTCECRYAVPGDYRRPGQ